MSKHVLLIDDDQDDAEIFSDALDELKLNARLSHFDDGVKALQNLANNTIERPNIIFLDINMPSIDGWECLREIKNIAYLQNIPIVMYSTSDFTTEKVTPRDVGASAFLTKPSNFEELKHKLSSLFGSLI